LEYEEIAVLRTSFLKVFKEEGIQGIKKIARNFRKEYRSMPTKVYKCNSSIYGNQSAGMEFEKTHELCSYCYGKDDTDPA
jgi:hypothetical protein